MLKYRKYFVALAAAFAMGCAFVVWQAFLYARHTEGALALVGVAIIPWLYSGFCVFFGQALDDWNIERTHGSFTWIARLFGFKTYDSYIRFRTRSTTW
jgi:hypothetical protein